MKIHSQATPHICAECKMPFRNVKKHFRNVHTFVELVSCPICEKKVKECYLKQHNLSHSKEKMSLTCPMCDKVFSNHASLIIHKRVQHYSTEKFTCEECGKFFGFKGYLRKHEYTHRQTQNTCPVCQRASPYEALLRCLFSPKASKA